LPLDELVARARKSADTEARASGVTVSADPRDAVAVNLGRDAGVYYVNPYTGEVRPAGPTRTHDFLHLMEDWHRFLARSGGQRPIGKAITGACNLAFLFLALSGLYLWWPRAWTARFVRPALWFNGSRGAARDWNWHNVVGFWSLPVLLVLTTSGAVIGYRWAGDLVYRLAGETPPAQAATPAYVIERPEGATKLTYADALARLQTAFPAWTTLTLREGLPPRRGAPPASGAQPSTLDPQPPVKRPTGPQPYSATLRETGRWYPAASTQVVIHPFTGEFLQRDGYADQTPGRQARLWLRYLHTGQALGWLGQLIAALACAGGLVLTYTGFALSWRRFCLKKKGAPAPWQ
ncbi:MAG TPA: PepSY-associated TM helix domain-containing protein, partial [Rariglobus sp.]